MSRRFSLSPCLLVLLLLLVSCSPGAVSPMPIPTSTPAIHPALDRPPLETQAAPTFPPPTYRPGKSYIDRANDISVGFLDVISFRANVNEQEENVEVVLRMRDIPDTATLGQVTNLVEYLWAVYVYLDPSQAGPAATPIDYYFGLNTVIDEPYTDVNEPIPGTPVTVPIHELFEVNSLYSASGSESTPAVEVNPDLNTLTLAAHIPRITSNAEFSFSMDYYDGTKDRPDSDTSLAAQGDSPSLPEATPTIQAAVVDRLIPAADVYAYPGPEHYAGDVLTFAIPTNNGFPEGTFHVSMSLDNAEPREVEAPNEKNC